MPQPHRRRKKSGRTTRPGRKPTRPRRKPIRRTIRKRRAPRPEEGWSSDIRTGYYNGQSVTYCAIGGLAIAQGDIVLGTVEQMEAFKRAVEAPRIPGRSAALRQLGFGVRWPSGLIPYENALTTNSGRVQLALAYFSVVPGLEFVPRTWESNYIRFVRNAADRCSSPVGMQRGRQDIQVGDSCTEGSLAHEICHALGLHHEAVRGDRDDFIDIDWSNVEEDRKHNFEMRLTDPGQNFGDYDYGSIMHYGEFAFAIDTSKRTITPKQAGVTIGQRNALSGGDQAVLRDMYPAEAPATPGESSDTGPALARKGNHVLLAWKGQGNDSLNVMSSFAEMAFNNKVTLPETSGNPPALGVLGSRFVLAWTGAGNNQLNVMQSSDGSTWSDKVTLNETSPSAPALTTVGNKLYLAWRGNDNRLNVRESFNGTQWSPRITLSDTTDSGPALGTIGGSLLVGWRGRGNNLLNVRVAVGGILPGTKNTLGETTDERPAFCTRGWKVFLAWRGTDNHWFNVMSSFEGGMWGDKFTSDRPITGGPAIASFEDNRLLRAWTDPADGNALHTRSFNQT